MCYLPFPKYQAIHLGVNVIYSIPCVISWLCSLHLLVVDVKDGTTAAFTAHQEGNFNIIS